MSQSQSQFHRPSLSQYSRSISQYMSSSIEEMSDNALAKLVHEMKRQVRILTLENEVLENTILRLEPALMHGVQQALELANKLHSTSSIMGSLGRSTSKAFIESLTSPSKILPSISPSKASTIFKRVESSGKVSGTIIFGSGPRINILERSELVSIEMESLVKNLEKCRHKAAMQQALLRAQLEELSTRMNDIEKATEVFNQQVIIDGYDKIAQRIPAEVWIRFMTEWVKICDRQIDKLRLRTSTMNSMYSKLKGQIKVKAELSEHLRPVDFEKMKIENHELVLAIERKLVQLEEVKSMAGDANLNMATHKKAMMEQNEYFQKVRRDIKNKSRLTAMLDKERDKIGDQVQTLEIKYDAVKKLRNAYYVPDIMDYVNVKAEISDLKRVIKLLENRYHVLQISLNSLNKKLLN